MAGRQVWRRTMEKRQSSRKKALCDPALAPPLFQLGTPSPPYSKGQGDTTRGLLFRMVQGTDWCWDCSYCFGRMSPGRVLAILRAGQIRAEGSQALVVVCWPGHCPTAPCSVMEESLQRFGPCPSRFHPGYGPHTHGSRTF